jgi:hypothetical protein
MKLAETIQLLSLFGFAEEEVRTRLAAGDSVHNAWEGLKLELEMRWDTFNQELGMNKLSELRDPYEKLMGLTLKSAKRKSEVEAENRRRIRNVVADTERRAYARGQKNLAAFMSSFEEQLRRGLKEEPDNPRLKEALARLERGESPF